MSPSIAEKLSHLPSKPGVYQFINSKGEIIYVGKAKNLRKRVTSYFTKISGASAKLRVLVSRIADIEIIIVETENDALLLENNLIKRYQPRYNVMLKDDKTYPWICIKNEPFPRVFSTRRVESDGSRYYGPYTSGTLLHTMLGLLKKLFPIRTCTLKLTQENITIGKFKTCLEYDIGNCKAPCVGLQSLDDYHKSIESIEQILKGNIADVTKHIKAQMVLAADQLRFEDAQVLKNKLDIIEKYQSKTTIVSPRHGNLDVFSIVDHEAFACVNYLMVIRGAILQSHNIEVKKTIDESKPDILAVAITELRERFSSKSKEILVELLPEFRIEGCSYTIPLRGDKLKLLELSQRNSKAFAHTRILTMEGYDYRKRENRILKAIQNDFRTPFLPRHIECFDNSNLQGTNPVAACVVFRNGKPVKREYRHFNIKTVQGPDDFASMYEVVHRRYSRLLDEGEELPQLVVVDGGKGQLSSAYKAIKELGIEQKVQLIGIAKRLEEIFFPKDPVPLYLDKNSESLKIIQHLRNEAHRFGIAHHRNKRSSSALVSGFDSIPGIGPKTIQALYKWFKTKSNIVNADPHELETVVGAAKSRVIIEYFRANPPNENSNN